MNLRADGDGGLYSTVPHRAVRMAQRSEAVSEEMRILYVALTRARTSSLLRRRCKPEKLFQRWQPRWRARAAEPYTLSQALSFSEWLCTAALLHPDCEELRKYAGGALRLSMRRGAYARARSARAARRAGGGRAVCLCAHSPAGRSAAGTALQNFGARYGKMRRCARCPQS